MRVVIASDHAGVEAKATLVDCLRLLHHTVEDLGTTTTESVDYPDYARQVAMRVAEGGAERGVLICGTGIGMCMTANKTPGIRAALVHDVFTTEMSRKHNDANVLCLGARVLAVDKIVELTKLWLKTDFEGGRHQRRTGKIG